MRKALVLHLSVLALLFGVFSMSAYGSPVFSLSADNFRDVVVDGAKIIVPMAAPGVMPIPEPTTLILLGSGLLGLLGNKARRRFRK